MIMNSIVGYFVTATVVLIIAVMWRRPRVAAGLVILCGLVPFFLMSWTVEPFRDRGTWLLGVAIVAALVLVGCTAQLALVEARRSRAQDQLGT